MENIGMFIMGSIVCALYLTGYLYMIKYANDSHDSDLKKDIEKALLKDKKVAKKIDNKYSQSVETDDKTFEKRMEDEDQKFTFLYFVGALLGVAFIGKSGILDSPPGLGSGFG